ncbi:hypothetical protein [Salmonirosea aquatica]
MKVYPRIEKDERKQRLATLNPQQAMLRRIALVVAFLSIFSFILKILFF